MTFKPQLRGIMVCVDYGDILALTLPYNRHHFKEVMVVTTARDTETINVAEQNNARVFCTDSFYEGGALFNKWLALELGLDEFGRSGWMCLMDADILWPKDARHPNYEPGNLYSPIRRICEPLYPKVPAENLWPYFQEFIDRQWAGYTQIFYSGDPVLPDTPWHAANWIHAGGADSDFQNLWPKENKIRPGWEVLHLGFPYRNWCGRTTRRVDGSVPIEAEGRADNLRRLIGQRRVAGTGDPYRAEKLPEPSGKATGEAP